MQGLAVTALQCVMTSTSWYTESRDGTTAPYSKFAQRGTGVPSQIGMVIIYLPALLAAAVVAPDLTISMPAGISSGPAGWQELLSRLSPAALCLFLHFAKRLFEVCSVHKYSGTVSAALASFIGACKPSNAPAVPSTTLGSTVCRKCVQSASVFTC